MNEAMSMWEMFGFVAAVLAATGVVAGGVGFAWKSFRSSGDEIDDRVIKNQETLIDQLTKQVADLTKRVDALAVENEVLKGLVMPNTVPPALDAALTGVTNRIIERVSDVEDHIAEGVLHMTNAVTALISELTTTMHKIQEAHA